MDGFHTFNTGNRKKFINDAKKKKQQQNKTSSAPQNQYIILKVQSNIRRFLASARLQEFILQQYDNSQNCMQEEECTRLSAYLDNKGKDRQKFRIRQRDITVVGNMIGHMNRMRDNQIPVSKLLFNYLHRLTISMVQQMFKVKHNKSAQLNTIQFFIKSLSEYVDKIPLILNRLTPQAKIFWIKRILPLTKDKHFNINNLKANQINFIQKLLLSNQKNFIQIFGTASLDNNQRLVEDFGKLLGRAQKSQPNLILNLNNSESSDDQFQQITQQMLFRCYLNINYILCNNYVQYTGQNSVFLIQCLYKVLQSLIHLKKLQILQQYKIKKQLLKSQSQFIHQLIVQKPQWQDFLQSIQISNPFTLHTINWFINLPDYDSALKISPFIFIVIDLIPLSCPLMISAEDLVQCLAKINDWVKVHEICAKQDQQQILLALLAILYRKLFKMTDKEFMAFLKRDKDGFERILKDKLIKIIYKVILVSKSSQLIQKICKISIQLLELIYNKIFRTGILNTEIFVNEALSKKFIAYSMAKSDNQIVEFIKKFPFIFPLKDRARKFRQTVTKYAFQNYYFDEYQQEQVFHGKVKIRRNHQFEDAFHQLKDKNIKKGFQIVFINRFGQEERGVDAGGLTKQFINRVLKAAFLPEFAMFLQNSDKQLLPHPTKAQHQQGIYAQYYQFIGKMIGKALYQGLTIGPKFCGPFLNAIIGKKNSFDDLSKIDKQLYNSLSYIKTMSQNAKQLQLSFQYYDESTKNIVNLKKNGHKIPVTKYYQLYHSENKDQYVELLADYKVNRLLEFQSRHIRRGLKKVIEAQWLFMFNYQQLNYLISGSGQIRIHQLRARTIYHGYMEKDKTIRLFWDVVENFDQENKSNLLMFVTGCPRPSFLGFEDMNPPFTIIKKQGTENLPVSHTCSNVLQLPNYQTRQLMQQKLKMAINSGSGFQLA